MSGIPRVPCNTNPERSLHFAKNIGRITVLAYPNFGFAGNFRCAVGFTGRQIRYSDVHDGFLDHDRTGNVEDCSALDVLVHI